MMCVVKALDSLERVGREGQLPTWKHGYSCQCNEIWCQKSPTIPSRKVI